MKSEKANKQDIKEEEDDLFPKVQKSELGLEALGQRIMEQKEQLKARVGLASI